MALREESTSTCLLRAGCSLTGQTRSGGLFPGGRGGQRGGPTPGAQGDGGDFWQRQRGAGMAPDVPVPPGSQVPKQPAELNEHKHTGCGRLGHGQISESTTCISENQKCITAWRPVSTHLPAHHLPLASSLPAPEEAESPGLRARSSPRSRTKTPPHFPKEEKPCPRVGSQWQENPWNPNKLAQCPLCGAAHCALPPPGLELSQTTIWLMKSVHRSLRPRER